MTETTCSRLYTLFLIFLVLKLCHVIDWSWWFVTIPLWGIMVGVIIISCMPTTPKKRNLEPVNIINKRGKHEQ